MERTQKSSLPRAIPRVLVALLCIGLVVIARAEEVKVTFNEVNFGPGVTFVDPLPEDAL